LAAAGSYLSARSQGGRWLVRIEDLDRERSLPGLADEFLRTLECFGFQWDGEVLRQSARGEIYDSALARLGAAGLHYPCRCSRSMLAALTLEPGQEPVYPGTCRDRPAPGEGPHALRFRIGRETAPVTFDDAIQGNVTQDCRREAGDFIICRRDGQAAYHRAVVVDDELQGVTEVVRGSDLLSSTPRQILLQRALGCRRQRYAHLPLLTEPDGQKLAKSRRAVPLEPGRAPSQLCRALGWLGMEPPGGLERTNVSEIWSWALPNWQEARLAGRRACRLPASGRIEGAVGS